MPYEDSKAVGAREALTLPGEKAGGGAEEGGGGSSHLAGSAGEGILGRGSAHVAEERRWGESVL